MSGKRWEKSELDILDQNVGVRPLWAISKFLLPHRTPEAIHNKIQEITSLKGRPIRFKDESHNVNYFTKLTDENCFFAGWLAADGYIGKDEHTIDIGINAKDIDILEKFKKAINSNSPIRLIESPESVGGYKSRLTIPYSKQLCLDLKKHFNIFNAKSLTLGGPNLIEESHIRHYLRGLYDGDGSYTFKNKNQHWSVQLVGPHKLLTWVDQKIHQYIKDIGNPSILSHKNIWQLDFSGPRSVNIVNWFYQDSIEQIRLNRKYNSSIQLLEYYKNYIPPVSRYRGVSLFKKTGKWKVELTHDYQYYFIGYFDSEIDAAKAYNHKALELGLEKRMNRW